MKRYPISHIGPKIIPQTITTTATTTIKQRLKPPLPFAPHQHGLHEDKEPAQTLTAFIFFTYKTDTPGNTQAETENISMTMYTDLYLMTL